LDVGAFGDVEGLDRAFFYAVRIGGGRSVVVGFWMLERWRRS